MVVGWLTRIVVILGVVAVIGYDGITAIQAQVTVRDQATSAAVAGLDNYEVNHDVQTAYQAALSDARSANPANTIKPADFVVSTSGAVTVTVTRPVHTLVAHYLPIPSATLASATGNATPSP
jgi:hypothetical protein